MPSLTKYQIEELVTLIEIRKETVEVDPESGDEFENTPGALQTLLDKVKSGNMNFSEAEVNFLSEECNLRKEVSYSAMVDEGISAMGLANSMGNVINKITTIAIKETLSDKKEDQ